MEQEPIDPLRRLPGYVLRRASVAVMGELAERLAPIGLRHVEATILLVLKDRPGMSQSALGRLLGIKRANMTPLAARLEEQGLIRRMANDGRTLELQLSPEGEQLARKVGQAIDAQEQALLERIAPEHRPHVLPILLALWGEQPAN